MADACGSAELTFQFLMWPDNETDLDLLGFDYLVDEVLVLLREPRLLPVTLGVAGDWGSGKSSLLRMTEAALEDDPRFLVVSFSPWRFEGHEDVKAALMATVLSRVQERMSDDAGLADKLANKVAKLVRRVNWIAVTGSVARIAAASQGSDLPPEVMQLASAQLLKPVEGTDDEGMDDTLHSIQSFREDFQALIGEMEDLQVVVVLIDDLDRCLPESIIETFEAIRLFLHVEKTAFVIAADQRIVRRAVEYRYPTRNNEVENVGVNYLEKLLQISVSIPALSEPEAETYINLLFAELNLETKDFEKCLNATQAHRQQGHLAVAMNFGIAKEAIGNIADALAEPFSIANQIAPVLARGLEGNPRQIKRFLNILELRQRTAKDRGLTLDPAVLAKLMILEQLHDQDFARIFSWQVRQDGRPLQLTQAEQFARSGKAPKGTSKEIKEWAEEDHIGRWLLLDPELTDFDLGPYFFFSRDRLSPAAPTARLPAALQALLARLDSGNVATRRDAVKETLLLGDAEFASIVEPLLTRAAEDLRGPALETVLEIAPRKSEVITSFFKMLASAPPTSVPPQLPMKLLATLKGNPGLEDLLVQWSGTSALETVATEALQALRK